MELLYSNILPAAVEDGQETIIDRFNQEIAICDVIDIAVGYVSRAALEELDNLISAHNVQYVSLIIGMYYVEGMPEGTYRTALALNEKWRNAGIGEIRMTKAFKFHGKLYVFHRDGGVQSAIIGSANLGVIKPEANNRRQYEVCGITQEPSECREILDLIRKVYDDRCSQNIAEITDIRIDTYLQERIVEIWYLI